MKKCERCGSRPSGEFELLDYCAECSTDLCPNCMAEGCCGNIPAESGEADDDEEAGAAITKLECSRTAASARGEPPERSRKEMDRKRKKRKAEHRAKLARKHAKSSFMNPGRSS